MLQSLVKLIKRIFSRSQYYSIEDATTVIRNFASGNQMNPYAWDDLETTEHSNLEVKIAVHLCWYYAGLYPAQKPTEYCGEKATPFFLQIADALENGKFKNLDFEKILQSLKENNFPEELRQALDLNK